MATVPKALFVDVAGITTIAIITRTPSIKRPLKVLEIETHD
jgi:hypothetical protein